MNIIIATRNDRVARYLLNSIGRRNALILFVIAGVMSVMDLVGIAIIFPYLQLVMQADATQKISALIGIALQNDLTHKQMVVLLSITLMLFYIVKTLAQAALTKIQAKKLSRFTEEITNRAISSILNARYAVFQQTPASEIAGIAYSNTVHATMALTAIIQVVNESLLLILLFIGFLIVQPMLALSTLLLAMLVILALHSIVVRRSAKIGAEQNRIENVRYKLLFAITSAIRDIKIMGIGGLFDLRNRRVSHEYAEITWKFSFNNMLPRLLIEFIALQAMVAFTLLVIILEIPLEKSGPLIGLIAIAAIRVAPSMSRLFGAISTYKSSHPVVEKLINLMVMLGGKNAEINCTSNLAFNHLIELRNIGFRYGDKKVLSNICMQLKRGESIGIVGPSGSGKTTLLDLFTGLQQATEGKFICDGVEIDPFVNHSIQKLIGYVPQAITLLDETIAFNVAFEDQPDQERVMRALHMANLHGFIASLPDGVITRVGENGLRLSGGQRQRIGIARALYRSPEILILDEATSSLDTHSEREITSEIEKLHGKISTIIVAHRLSTVSNCDRIYVLADGLIESSGTYSELLRISKIFNQLYSAQSHIQYESNTLK